MSFPVITHEELLSHAADTNTYARAEAYQENVFDVNYATNEDNEFVVSCQCELYYVITHINYTYLLL